MFTKRQFVTLLAAILMVGATTIGVNLSVIGTMGEANDARFERTDARIEALERRMDEGFREMGAAIARLEDLIQGIHGPAQAASGAPARPS